MGSELTEALRGLDVTSAPRSVLDITDGQAVADFIGTGRFTHVVNSAAYTAVDRAESDAETCRRVNVDGVENIVRAIGNTATKLIHISTDYVFDGKGDAPYAETDAPRPLSVYGLSKLESEKVISEHDVPAVVIRTGWLYSSYGRNFVKTILKMGAEGKRLRVVADQTGTPTCAADLAQAIRSIILAPEWIPGVYHYGGEGRTTWFGFARTILELAGITAEIEPCSTAGYGAAAERPAFSVLDKSKIKRIYGIDIPYWKDSLRSCLEKIINVSSNTPNP